MMNHTIPIVKSQSSNYKSHLAPIAPAPLNLAPKPVHVLPKPSSINDHQSDHLETQSLPCVITSKQWVLPPRPKAGRKPTNDKKKIQLPQHSNTPQAHSNVSKLSTNLTNLNLHKSQSEIINLKDEDLKCQLDTATQENQKLKNIISRLKVEIESLQASHQHHLVQQPPPLPQPQSNSQSGPTPIPLQQQQQALSSSQRVSANTAVTSGSQEVSTPINTMSQLTSREVSPTIDPKTIQQEVPVKRTKRQYRKKKKPTAVPPSVKQELPTPTQTPTLKTEDNTPSPISLVVDHEISSNLPNLEFIMQRDSSIGTNNDLDEYPRDTSPQHCFKKSKTIRLERSMSLQPEPMPSSSTQHFKSIGLDRTMSIPMEFLEGNLLSRSTTNTSSFDVCKRCGNDSCLCLESGHIDDFNDEFKVHKDFTSNHHVYKNHEADGAIDHTSFFNANNNQKYNSTPTNVNNEENEFDVNFFIESEVDDDQFLMI